jgi:16S rRNA pseudouridine516 synthase
MGLERLDKLIADSGRASRREAKSLIKACRVTVNGMLPRSGEEKFDPEQDTVCIDGEPISCTALRYILMNKPGGVLSATEDASQKTVIDLLPAELRRLDLFPVGRLDKDTTGLLLLTNDGGFAHRVISPKHRVPKRYRAAVDGVLDETDIAAFAQGLVLADGLECLPAKLEIIKPSVGIVTVYEGKYHQVKRMLASRGKHVTALHRLSVGALELPEGLAPGQYAELTAAEAARVYE